MRCSCGGWMSAFWMFEGATTTSEVLVYVCGT
jgi:hypothetical protein